MERENELESSGNQANPQQAFCEPDSEWVSQPLTYHIFIHKAFVTCLLNLVYQNSGILNKGC